MKIKDHQDGKLILLSKSFRNRARGLVLFLFIFFLGSLLCWLWLFLESLKSEGEIGMTIFVGLVGIIFSIITYKYGNKAFKAEKIFVNKKEFRIITDELFRAHTAYFDITRISNFRHLADMKQQAIDELDTGNKIAFEYEGRTITFGENIYSWDFEQVQRLLYDLSGNDLEYEDENEKK